MKRSAIPIILFALVLTVAAVQAKAIQDLDQVVAAVERSLLPAGKVEVILKVWGPIPAGTEIRGTKELALTAPAEGYAVYIDDYPTANLFHAVRYAFVGSEDGRVVFVHAMSPPLNDRDYQVVETAVWKKLMSVGNRRAPIPQTSPPPVRADRWAVLMNGGYDSGNNHVRYWNDLSNIYITLNYTYGYADDHIIVLCSDGTNPAPDQSNGQNSNPDLDNDGDADIMYSCILSNVDQVFGWLATHLTSDDKLFIFTTDHGSSAGGWNTVQNLWNHEELTDAHFAELLAALPQCEIICTLEPCFSGGFLDNIVVPPGPIVASSACRYDEYSWAMSNLEYDEYVFHWTAAVKGSDAYGAPVNADYNHDGIVSMTEAFQYAYEHDTASEEPQYGDYPHGIGAGISLWPTGPGPFLVVADRVLDDIGGNNNGAPDPGETVSMLVTLSNVGNSPATNIQGTLSSTDPYLTITQNLAAYPNLGHFEQGQGTPAYQMNISAACPHGTTVTCNLHLAADSAYSNDVVISFVVGDPLFNPTGPDQHGYLAYDPFDVPELPVYQWVEISADSGGLGTMVPFVNDDQTFSYALPFSFRYYGADFDSFTVAANGWIGMGVITADDYSNSGIPNADGPPNMIAGYWEDLSPQRANSGKIWRWFDAAGHRLIVEYNHVEQYAPTGNFETFQIILFDPAHYPTPTGDGRILFQYKWMSGAAANEGTIGIENGAENDGLQYFFDGAYDPCAHAVTEQFALLFATSATAPAVTVSLTPYGTPIQIPAGGGVFNFNIAVANQELTPQAFQGWCDVTLPNGSTYGPVLGPISLTLPSGASINRDRTQSVPASAPAGAYAYNAHVGNYPSTIWASDQFPFTKLSTGDGVPVTGWENTGESFDQTAAAVSAPEAFALQGVYPNPFNPVTRIRYDLPEAVRVSLQVYDIGGRRIAELANGWREAGSHEVSFDASRLPSGVYVVRLEAGDFSAAEKVVLMK
jgi:hypothetical protein